MPLELGRGDPGQHARTEGTLLNRRWRFGSGNDLAPLAALRAGIRVPHVLDDIGLGLLQFELLGDVRANDDPLGPAATARPLVILQWMIFAANREEIRKHELAT